MRYKRVPLKAISPFYLLRYFATLFINMNNTLQWWISPRPIHIRRNIVVRADAVVMMAHCPSDGMVTNSFCKQSKIYLQNKNHPTAHLLNRKFREKLSICLFRDTLLGGCWWTGESLQQIVLWRRKIEILVVSALPEVELSQLAKQSSLDYLAGFKNVLKYVCHSYW